MTSAFTLEVGVTYGLLTSSIIGLWIFPLSEQRLRPAFWNLFFVLSVGYAIGAGLLEPVAIPFIAAFGMAVHVAEQDRVSIHLRLFAVLISIGLAVVLMGHLLPGFIPFKVIDSVRISPDALPYGKNLNIDKPVVGLAILALGPRLLSTPAEWKRMIRTAGAGFPWVVMVLLVLSVALGYVRLDVKWPAFGWIWMWTNLFFTCIPEEALFRGMVQRHLDRLLVRYRHGAGLALVTAAVCFGMAHFAGGPKYVILATAAGLGYGIVYQRTGSIEASILTHFGLNTLHFIFFTYPALATAMS